MLNSQFSNNKITISKFYLIPKLDFDIKYFFRLVLVCFIIPPIVTIPYAMNSYFKSRKYDEKVYMLIFVAFASYLAVINASKYPAGDQYAYWSVYMKAPIKGLWWCIMHIYGHRDATNGKEFMNGIYNYYGYYLTGGCYPLYIYINTLFVYLPFFFFIKKIFENSPHRKYAVFAGVVCLTFFTQFFNLTIHLQRQVLAYSIIIWIYYVKAKTGKINFLLLFLAFFTHSTAIFFVPFVFFDIFFKRMSKKRMLLVGGILVVLFAIVGRLAGSVETKELSNNTLTYSVSRIQYGQTDEASFHIEQYLMLNIPLFIICLMNMFKKGLSRFEYITYNTYVILFLFVMSMSGSELIQYRYSFFTYGYIGFILPKFIASKSERYRNYLGFICFFFIIRFYYTFDDIIWHYDSILKSLCNIPALNTFNVWYGDITRFLPR